MNVANYGEVDAISGSAISLNYEEVPGGHWKEIMPIELEYMNNILVVDAKDNVSRIINSIVLRDRHIEFWDNKYIAGSYSYPINNYMAMQKGLHAWALFAAPNTKFPYFLPSMDSYFNELDKHSQQLYIRELNKKFRYYRLHGIIK